MFRYLKFDINSFVETSRSIKWCPGPGCQRAVRLPLPDVEVGKYLETVSIETIVEMRGRRRKSHEKKRAKD